MDIEDQLANVKAGKPPKDPLVTFLVMYIIGALHRERFELLARTFMCAADPDQSAKDAPDSRPEAIRFDAVTLQSFATVTREMVIVYEMAILDSFLNSLTNYLFHFAPERILGTTAIEVRQLISKSRTQVLSECIAKKVSVLSKESIVNRIRALEDIFGIKFEIGQKKWKEVKRFVKVRNRIVHEGYTMAVTIGDDLAPKLEPIKTVEEDEMRFDDLELRGVVDIVYRQIVCDVLGRELNELEVTCLDALMMRRARRGEGELAPQLES